MGGPEINWPGVISTRHTRAFYWQHLLLVVALLLPAVGQADQSFLTGASVSEHDNGASISVLLACHVNYVNHAPTGRASTFRIQIDSTQVCNGSSPTVARTQQYYLPARSEKAKLTSMEYDGTAFGNPMLTLTFSDPVNLSIDTLSGDRLSFSVDFNLPEPAAVVTTAAREVSPTRQVQRSSLATPVFVINLESSLRPPATGDIPDLELANQQQIFTSTVNIDGKTWYRTRLGYFSSRQAAEQQLRALKQLYPGAWIDMAKSGERPPATATVAALSANTGTPPAPNEIVEPATSSVKTREPVSDEKLLELMNSGRDAMRDGRLSEAVQIYTKVLMFPPHQYMPEAQEYLGLARERNGQLAHAKAEYQRYIALYPDSDGVQRVQQRLSAMMAGSKVSERSASESTSVATTGPLRTDRQTSPWRVQTFFSQYYRRDVNQIDENDAVISQSSLFSDMNFDARRRGTRFDFGSRISAGYRHDLLPEESGSGSSVRVSYAYADLADARTGLRGRLGRQSKNSGGILGRFDGFDLGYAITDRTLLSAVVGKPVNSASDGIDDSRSFYGLSANFGPIGDALDVGGFYVKQNVDGMSDREAIGAELRYFDTNKSLWGLADYDISYNELGSAFLQGTWRFDSDVTLNGMIDRRHSPFLSTSNAIIGQGVEDLSDLFNTFDEDQLRQLSLDRSAIATTYTAGASAPLTPKLQINGTLTQSVISSTPESGGVAATPESVYQYVGLNLVASSLLKEGDVAIVGLRYSTSGSSNVYSINFDTRYPFSRTFYFNPRIRVDYREVISDGSSEWIFTPGLRMQMRFGRRFRVEFEAGKQFASRDLENTSMDRQTYFVNLGYQAFF